MDCLFCKIIAGEIPSKKVVENDRALVIEDIRPRRAVHLLALPKKHIASFHAISELTAEDQLALNAAIVEAATGAGIAEKGYRVISNVGEHGGQEVPHLHVHILGGEPVGPIVS